MDTTTTPQTQRQNFADFWQAGQQQQQQIPSSSAPISSMPPAFFYSPSIAGQRPQAAAIQPNHPPSQQPSSANVDSNEQQLQPIAPSTDPPNIPNAFQAALQPNHSFSGNFDFFGAERAAMAPSIHSGFRPPPQIGTTPHFGPSATAGVGNFQNFPAGLLHPGPTVPLPSVVVSVGFDCMGLMNNFGLNSAVTSSHSQFAVPQTPPALQSSSAALMPLAMSAIYATGGGGIQRSSSFLNNSAMANRPPLPLGQSASTGTLSNGTANATNLQPNATSQLFDLDLSNNSAVSNATSAASVIAAAVTGGSFQQTRPPKINDDAQQLSSFGPFAGAKIPAEIAKIPKETASIPLESREGTSSSSGGTEQRTQSQMSCQVCHLAASNGLHFGARTCAACAAFFRRSISDQKRYICKRSQRCVIRPSESGTQGYRKMCRNCRMKRCLEIGMLPENVQNKRNKREYYFVDALNNAIQQSAGTVGVIGQQQSRRDRQSPIMSIGMGQQIKNEVGKLLLGAPLNGGGLPPNGGGGRQHPPQLNPVEKFEPMEKESPPIGMPNGLNNQQQPVVGQPPFQSVAHQPHLLAPIQMMGAVGLNNTQSFPIEFGAQKDTAKGEVDEGRPIYSTPTTTTANQQQQPMVAQFWGITTLREI